MEAIGGQNQRINSGHKGHLAFNFTDSTILGFWQTFDSAFDVTFVIQDIADGQLAESQITDYDALGRPIAGTLTLDIDGNGLGWYIDLTPEDNSEYSQSLTLTAFKATPGSAAYRRYDLVTTILHELGHLQGITSGNSAYDAHIKTFSGHLHYSDHARSLPPRLPGPPRR